MQTDVDVQFPTAEAALSNKRGYISPAAMLNTLTAAKLDLDRIWVMAEKLFGYREKGNSHAGNGL